MSEPSRDERLLAELASLQSLADDSTIFDFDPAGDPPDRYTVRLRGKGIARDTSSPGDIEFVNLHRFDIRLPFSYPERGPDIRWLTPIFHPNVSFSGFLNLREIGFTWERDVTLDLVCERLWDVVRMAFINSDKASNFSAKNWLEKESTLRLPLDQRPIRDKLAPAGKNIIRYERRGESSLKLPQLESDDVLCDDVLYIGEDTPVPELPPRRDRPRRAQPNDDEDILFIGE